MKRSGAVKFPNSVQLFKLCQKVLTTQRGSRVHDQEVGAILNFNPSDCSHWKRGEKNVRSVFSLAKLSAALHIEATLIHDVASGAVGLDEAYYEWQESNGFKGVVERAMQVPDVDLAATRQRIEAFVDKLHEQSEYSTPPLYIPEVMRFFAFIATQPTEMMDRLSRVLRTKPGQYAIQFRKGDLKPQTRMGMVKDLGRILFEAERARFPELGPLNAKLVELETMLFTANLLVPKAMLLAEMAKLDTRRNVVAELATLFWVPKSLVSFQVADILRSGDRPAQRPQSARATEVSSQTASA